MEAVDEVPDLARTHVEEVDTAVTHEDQSPSVRSPVAELGRPPGLGMDELATAAEFAGQQHFDRAGPLLERDRVTGRRPDELHRCAVVAEPAPARPYRAGPGDRDRSRLLARHGVRDPAAVR